jgi:hypothetical protein
MPGTASLVGYAASWLERRKRARDGGQVSPGDRILASVHCDGESFRVCGGSCLYSSTPDGLCNGVRTCGESAGHAHDGRSLQRWAARWHPSLWNSGCRKGKSARRVRGESGAKHAFCRLGPSGRGVGGLHGRSCGCFEGRLELAGGDRPHAWCAGCQFDRRPAVGRRQYPLRQRDQHLQRRTRPCPASR